MIISNPVRATPKVHRSTTTVLLHLLPGAAALAAYVGFLRLTSALVLPSVAALAATGLIVAPAVQLGVLGVHRRRRPCEPVIGLNVRLPLPRLLGWAVLEIVLAGAAFAVTAPLIRLIQTRMFGWWPQPWTIRLGTDGHYSGPALLITAVLLLIGTVIVAPVVEERYFRGYLLPRMPRQLGRWTAPAHAALFAGYHVWSPWLIPTRALAILPLTYVALRTRDVRIGMVTHLLLNATDLVALVLYIRAA